MFLVISYRENVHNDDDDWQCNSSNLEFKSCGSQQEIEDYLFDRISQKLCYENLVPSFKNIILGDSDHLSETQVKLLNSFKADTNVRSVYAMNIHDPELLENSIIANISERLAKHAVAEKEAEKSLALAAYESEIAEQLRKDTVQFEALKLKLGR